jgi:hypothetical protein
LIHEYHDHYVFEPHLPVEVAETCSLLENFHRHLKAFCPEAAYKPLARLHGTIAQHYGFCGPSWLARLEYHAAAAQQAFGGGEVEEYKEDWKRQFNYLFYAYIDSDMLEPARDALRGYLEWDFESWRTEGFDSLNAFQHAALARFFARTKAVLPSYMDWAHQHLNDRPIQHPWQLWLYNIGLQLGDETKKSTAWRLATTYCLAQGPPIQVMAFMPLAELWRARLASREWIKDQLLSVVDRLRVSSLSRDHFHSILGCSSPDEVVSVVARDHARIFPFTYR